MDCTAASLGFQQLLEEREEQKKSKIKGDGTCEPTQSLTTVYSDA
jgi:nanoRNase/pAp phosphatase (c-di-AMP/oligoRNAs hydrolase)